MNEGVTQHQQLDQVTTAEIIHSQKGKRKKRGGKINKLHLPNHV